ncbi:exosome RNA helicase MTR4-like [Xenia sp. Carnegie-2017]|uniref:exosome RNA helicase MTR4-like n=1 Tax=Xenia sp. Carnegie-2017 TaxID=2897299 RepID=UPI001F040A71|nr:exosome RNA helicase MTR4-like [Xenia sp. Carnegie-2017]
MADFEEDLFSVFNDVDRSKKDGKTVEVTDYDDKDSLKRIFSQRGEKRLHGECVDGNLLSTTQNDENLKKVKRQDDESSIIDSVPIVDIITVETFEACTHEVAVPQGIVYNELKVPTTKPAKEYPFILDPFQKEALSCIENNHSVLVSAHTSAGKTVVAEYAIALSLRNKQRVIYTTPIKALSNQKYRELYEEFQDVGLMTGDVTINPSASALVMTTEILRSMLYRGSEVMREVAWVVFDEIHYMRDKERGVVWEETIILLPDNVHYVFLSATIPNASQFTAWIAHLHRQPCHAVYTEYRPTPLQHYIYPAGGDGLFLVVDENGAFREDNFQKSMAVIQEGPGSSQQRGRKGGTKGPSNTFKIVKMIMERKFQPVIVFSFSKKECEAYALQMSKLDFNTDEERKLVEEVFNNAIDCLSDDDKKLPQVEHVLPLLKRGIGIHHSGLLPILKETIEILFSEGLIKALFATETFALGLNMPARTVVFTNPRKFDGKDFRWITSGEYIQMSGRAGRRGLDDRGIVILIIDEKMGSDIGKGLLKGSADPLNSAFRLTYNMVLNLLRVEEVNPEIMLERSFYQYQNYATIPEMIQKLKDLETKRDAIVIHNEESIASFYKIRHQLKKLGDDMLGFIHRPKYCLPFMQPGRLVHVKHEDMDFDWGVVINFQKKAKHKSGNVSDETLYVLEVLVNCSLKPTKTASGNIPNPCPPGEKGEMQVIPVLLKLIQAISSVRLYIPKDIRSLDARQNVGKSIQEVKKRFKDGLPLLDPIDDMGIKDEGLKSIVRKIEALEHKLYTHPMQKDPDRESLYQLCEQKSKVIVTYKASQKEIKKCRTVLQMDELKCRKRVLRRLGYSTSADVIELKGRVACEISSADELVLTEMIFNGVFNDLTVEQCTALLSCFIFQEKSSEMPKMSEQLSGPLRQLQETARRIAKVSQEAKLDVEIEDYVESFKPQIMDVVYSWSKGASFSQICKMTDVFEGSVIRCMRRLEELLRQMCQAAKAIGNTELENKFAEGITKIKRDIVFAASLYL